MFNLNEIARKLLALREKSTSGYAMSGQLREELGFEGYGEALRRRWIMADESGSGMVTVTNHLNSVEEIRQLASENKECCKGCKDEECTCMCKDGKCVCKKKMESLEESAHSISAAHALRNQVVVEYSSPFMSKREKERQKNYDDDMKVNPESGMSHAPDCDCTVCEKRRSKKQKQSTKESVLEYATLGLGRTGEAPETPVVGLGNAHSAPVTSVKPPVSAAGVGTPPITPAQNAPYGAATQPGSMTASALQADSAAQKKFGRPFSQLSPDQQAQIDNDMRTTTPPV